jgi:hypothetical protein
MRAGRTHGNVHRHHETVHGFARRERQVGTQHHALGRFAEKRIAHAFDDWTDRWKVDRNLIRETLVRHRKFR